MFLDQYKTHGAGVSWRDFAKRIRRPVQTIDWWRRTPKFATELGKLEERNLKLVPSVSKLMFPTDGLDAWMIAYLEEYLETIDGTKARGAAKVSFQEVEEAKLNHHLFAKRLDEIEQEHAQRARDMLKQQGIIGGKISAIKQYLEAEDVRYGKRVKHEVSGGFTISPGGRAAARLTMGEMFKGHLGPAEDDVVEAEVVEAT